jgi:hypothetical protein
MFGWRMEEEAKLEFTITVKWRREDGSIATTQLATLNRGAWCSADWANEAPYVLDGLLYHQSSLVI